MAFTAGYDVGGAHLKVALVEDGRTIAVRQIPCPLWRGLDHLESALADAADLTRRADNHAATMTGELCEVFTNRVSGVHAILDCLQSTLGTNLRVWMGTHGLGDVTAAHGNPLSVASTNFLASAALVAQRLPDALLIDMGSTTTDIIPITGGAPRPRGMSDGDRLRTGELVYSGTTRTEVTSVARRAHLDGVQQRLAAGGFANMADVRRVLGTLPDGVDQHATLDGRGKTHAESLERFARCFGRDAIDAAPDAWNDAAREIIALQMTDIADAVSQVLATSALPDDAPIVAAGIGAYEIMALAHTSGRPAQYFADIAKAEADCWEWATRCAPAVAVALLAHKI